MSQIIYGLAAVVIIPRVVGKALELFHSSSPRPAVARQNGGTPTMPPKLAQILNQKSEPPSQPAWNWKLRLIMSCLVLHELMILFEILFNPPTNIFTNLGVPPNTVVSKIRSKLMELSETPVLPPHLTHLLQKLQSFDTRVYYVRFGHEAVVSCTNCFSFSDYYAYYGSRIAAEYARTCLLVGFMTIKGSGKRRWRKWAVAAIFSAFFLEVVQIGTAEVYMGGGASTCTMWADKVWWYRHLFFLVLPVVLYLLPYSYLPKSPLPPLLAASNRLDHVAELMNTSYLVREGGMRNPMLRRRTSDWYEAAERDATWGREDQLLQEETARLTSSVGDGPAAHGDIITENVKRVLESFRPAMQPPKMPNEAALSPSDSSSSHDSSA